MCRGRAARGWRLLSRTQFSARVDRHEHKISVDLARRLRLRAVFSGITLSKRGNLGSFFGAVESAASAESTRFGFRSKASPLVYVQTNGSSS